MDNIDWVKVKEQEKDGAVPLQQDSDEDEEPDDFDENSYHEQMLQLMKPGETVSKALRRLGGGTAGLMAGSASARLKAKKMKLSGNAGKSVDPSFTKLTELSNELVQRGNMEIFQDTYEKLSFKVKMHNEKLEKEKLAIPEGINDDDALDMFADDFDKKQGEKTPRYNSLSTKGSSENKPSSSKNDETSSAGDTKGMRFILVCALP